MIAFGFVGCAISSIKGGPDYSSVRAYIEEGYSEKFDAMEFCLEDFDFSNISDFSFRYYTATDPNDEDGYIISERFLLINLKKTGKKYAQEAITSLNKQEFVKNATFSYHGTYDGELLQ